MALNSRCRVCRALTGPEDNDGANTQPDLCARCRTAAADPTEETPFERIGRLRKVLAMVGVIDRNALANDINPYDQAGRIVLASYSWGDAVWRSIAVRAGTAKDPKPPSSKTRDAVVAVYRDRARAPLSKSRAS